MAEPRRQLPPGVETIGEGLPSCTCMLHTGDATTPRPVAQRPFGPAGDAVGPSEERRWPTALAAGGPVRANLARVTRADRSGDGPRHAPRPAGVAPDPW